VDWLIKLFQSIVFQTVIAGTLVFILSEFMQKFFLLPLQKYKEVIAKIDNRLKFYANIISNPGPTTVTPRETILECLHMLRNLSCELEAAYKQIPFKTKNRNQKVSDAARRLIGLSNSLGATGSGIENHEDIKIIREKLNIESL